MTFRNTERVIEALSHGVALVDRSHWGRLRVAGGDRLALLHNQSTADFKALKPGQGCDTVSEMFLTDIVESNRDKTIVHGNALGVDGLVCFARQVWCGLGDMRRVLGCWLEAIER